jgi:hypothetical protein
MARILPESAHVFAWFDRLDKERLSDKVQTYANSESLVFVPRPAIPQYPQPPASKTKRLTLLLSVPESLTLFS